MNSRSGRRAQALGALLVTSACSAPLGPPPPGDELAPPRYLAADCAPVAEVAVQHDVTTNAFLADLDEGRSCEIFLEQDECILAIFRDCSYDGVRQWVGKATSDASGVDLVLSPMFEKAPPRPPPRRCTGHLPDTTDPRSSTRLACEGAALEGLYLERKDFSVKPFGARVAAEQLPLGNNFGTIDVLPDVLSVAVGDTSQLWLVVNWSGGNQGGGVYRVQGTGEAPVMEQVDDVSRPRVIGASPESTVLVAAGDEMGGNMDLLVYDASATRAANAKTTTVATTDTIFHIAGASGDRFAVAKKQQDTPAHVVELYTYDRAARRLTKSARSFAADRNTSIQALVWSKPAKPEAVAFMVAMSFSGNDDGIVVGLDDDLNEVWRHTSPTQKFDVRSMEPLTGRGRVGLILAGGERDYEGPDQSNHYYELDPATGAVDPVVALPFANTQELSYDATRDRMYIAQRFGVVGYVERSPRVRAAQGYFKLDRADEHTDVVITAMAWDPNRERIVIADPRRGVLDSIKLAP